MLKLKTILVRKPINYQQVIADQKQMIKNFHTPVESFDIESVIELSHDEYEEFKNNLLCERDFLKGIDEILLVKEVGSDDYSGIIVDVQGSDYPRFAGIPMRELDIKKCPKCSKIYYEHPATSRTDNKLEICPACGVEEALDDFSSLLKFLKRIQDDADHFNATITIQIPGKEDIVIQPEADAE